ncbi:DNA ligase 4 [Grifola frondosa]|uniref:DNA ligase n=1 Tax=Grifola frondosa TaxID=5627 RepID=A0A1C7MBY1_GRIFR|nr:DNA ligase 4 [Grifola frondosa]
MMQPTPAPSSPPSSPTVPAVVSEDHPIVYPEPPKNVGNTPFRVLAILFDKLQNEKKPEKRRKMLGNWFNRWRKEEGYDLYPVLRLILPYKDRERTVYGLKEKNIAKDYIKIIPLSRNDPDAIRLLNWKRPTEREKASGDFPSVLYEVISKRSSVVEGSLTIHELNDILDELAKSSGKSHIQSQILRRVYNRSTPEEQRWIIRIILKDMIIAVKETTVFSVFHPDAHDLFNTCSDLKKVAWELWNPDRRLNDEDKAVQLFRAFAPMLCKRPTRGIDGSVKEMQGRTFIIEEKLDGERMQLHKQGNEYFYCSRKGKDYTYLYGKHVGIGSLTPFIDDAFDSRVDEIILDGEMLVWDPVSETNLPFGSLKTFALDKSKGEHNPRPCFKVFDLLYLNGLSLLHKSLKFRKRNLRACLQEVPGRIEFVSETEGTTAQMCANVWMSS